MTQKQIDKFILEAAAIEENARLLTDNLKISFLQTGLLQAQDVARIERLYEQAHNINIEARRIYQ